jgi:hypothetical protein
MNNEVMRHAHTNTNTNTKHEYEYFRLEMMVMNMQPGDDHTGFSRLREMCKN